MQFKVEITIQMSLIFGNCVVIFYTHLSYTAYS